VFSLPLSLSPVICDWLEDGTEREEQALFSLSAFLEFQQIFGALTPLILLINETLEMDRWRPPSSPSLTLLFHHQFSLSLVPSLSLFLPLTCVCFSRGKTQEPQLWSDWRFADFGSDFVFFFFCWWLWSIRSDWERVRVPNGLRIHLFSGMRVSVSLCLCAGEADTDFTAIMHLPGQGCDLMMFWCLDRTVTMETAHQNPLFICFM